MSETTEPRAEQDFGTTTNDTGNTELLQENEPETKQTEATEKTRVKQINFEMIKKTYLLQDSSELYQCPYGTITLERITLKALLDSGSEITCISEAFYLNHGDALKNCMTLPVVGMTVSGAIGGKSVRIKKQMYAEIDFGSFKHMNTFIIVPRSEYDCIIGVDTFKPCRSIMNFGTDETTFKDSYSERKLQ